jgi:hypothetical protein
MSSYRSYCNFLEMALTLLGHLQSSSPPPGYNPHIRTNPHVRRAKSGELPQMRTRGDTAERAHCHVRLYDDKRGKG